MSCKNFKRAVLGLGVAIASFMFAPTASAIVIDSADVNGFRTFTDTNTGRVWLDFDNFFNMSFDMMALSATNAGFTVADSTAVNELLASVPIPMPIGAHTQA